MFSAFASLWKKIEKNSYPDSKVQHRNHQLLPFGEETPGIGLKKFKFFEILFENLVFKKKKKIPSSCSGRPYIFLTAARPFARVSGSITSFGWAFLHSTIFPLISWKWISQTFSTLSSLSNVMKPKPKNFFHQMVQNFLYKSKSNENQIKKQRKNHFFN